MTHGTLTDAAPTHRPRPAEHAPTRELPSYSALDLTQGGDLAQIMLGAQTYVLRITRAGKLILTK